MKRLLIVLVLLSCPAWASIAYVSASHTVCIQTSSGSSTQTCTLAAATTAGNTVVVGLAWKDTTRTFTSVVGSAATSFFYQYTPVTCNSTNVCVMQAICVHCPALTTVKPTFSGGTVFATTAEEYSGVGSVGFYATATGSSAAPAITISTSDANDWIVVSTANLGNAGIPTSTTGNLRDANRTGSTSSHVAGAVCDNTVSSAGSVTCQGTITSGTWAAVGTELRSVAAPQSYIWPNCDSTHPCLIHHYMSGMAPSDPSSMNDFKLTVDPSKSGNLLAVVVSHEDTDALSTVSDDKSNTWVAGPSTDDSGNALKSELWYVCGATTGTSVITFHFASAVNSTSFRLQFTYFEASGIATSSCLDGTATAAHGLNGNSIQPGSITTADKSLVYNYAVQGTNFPESDPLLPWIVPADSTSLVAFNPLDKVADSIGVNTSGGSLAINPAFYLVDPNARVYNDLGIAFKASSGAGTQPSGMNITRILAYYTQSGMTQVNAEFPTTGNLTVSMSTYPSDTHPITNFADGVNTYTSPSAGAGSLNQSWYSCNSTADGQRRVTFTQTDFIFVMLYDIAGAATSCFDTAHNVTGSQTNAGDTITVTNAVTPTTSNGMILTSMKYGTGPPSNVTAPSGAVFDSLWATGMSDSDNFASGDAYIHYINPNTSAVTYTVTNANDTASSWEALSLAFKAQASARVRKRVGVTRR